MTFDEWLDQGHRCGCNENMRKAWNAALESRVLAEREPVAWAVPQEMAGASFIACCVQGGAYTVPLFTHPTPDDAR